MQYLQENCASKVGLHSHVTDSHALTYCVPLISRFDGRIHHHSFSLYYLTDGSNNYEISSPTFRRNVTGEGLFSFFVFTPGETFCVAKGLDARYDWLPFPNTLPKYGHLFVVYVGDACSPNMFLNNVTGQLALVSNDTGACSYFTKVGVEQCLLFFASGEDTASSTSVLMSTDVKTDWTQVQARAQGKINLFFFLLTLIRADVAVTLSENHIRPFGRQRH